MNGSSRTKGAEGEREVIRALRANGWPHAYRSSNGRDQHARGDIARGPEYCHIEIKRQERLNIPKAFDQIAADAGPLDTPILVHRPSRHCWMATLPLDDLLELLRHRETA